jgi:ABC-2 type transport system ATP-binding protein
MQPVHATVATPCGEPVLQVRGLRKSYGVLQALSSFDLSIRSGEIVGLLGPNGAGKTTAIEAILGLRPPDAGEVRIGGYSMRSQSRAALARVGAQLQSTALPDAMTPLQALRLRAAFYPDPDDPTRLLRAFQLDQAATQAFRSLSGGQRQRLALALALVNRPALLILDEPAAGLDPALRRELLETITSERDRGCAILLATHLLDDAEQLCDRVCILHQGNTLAMESPTHLLQQFRAVTEIHFRTRQPLTTSLQGLNPQPCVDPPCSYRLQTREAHATLLTLVQALEAGHHALLSLDIRPPTLESVYLQLLQATPPAVKGRET